MKRICIIIFALFLSVTAFAVDFEPSRIINGKVVKSKNSPYIQIFEYNIDHSDESIKITATMVSNKHVVMPAHFVNYPNSPQQYVAFINGKPYLVKSIQIPDDFDPKNPCLSNNIAILTLKRAVPKKVKKLPFTKKKNDFDIGTTVTYYGYGCDNINLDCSSKGSGSPECATCWGKLRKGSSKITIIEDDVVLLEENKDANGFVDNDGGSAAIVKVKRKVVKKVKNKSGKIRKVKKIVKKDAIIGLNSCYGWFTENSQIADDTRALIPLFQNDKIIKFIKKATKNKAKII